MILLIPLNIREKPDGRMSLSVSVKVAAVQCIRYCSGQTVTLRETMLSTLNRKYLIVPSHLPSCLWYWQIQSNDLNHFWSLFPLMTLLEGFYHYASYYVTLEWWIKSILSINIQRYYLLVDKKSV